MMPEKMLVDEIIRQLDQSLEVEFSFYQIEIPAEAISLLPAQQQNFVLDWVERAASINITVGSTSTAGNASPRSTEPCLGLSVSAST